MEYLAIFAAICQITIVVTLDTWMYWSWVSKIPIKDDAKKIIGILGAPISLTYLVGKIFSVRGLDYEMLQLVYVFILIIVIVIICKIYYYVKKKLNR